MIRPTSEKWQVRKLQALISHGNIKNTGNWLKEYYLQELWKKSKVYSNQAGLWCPVLWPHPPPGHRDLSLQEVLLSAQFSLRKKSTKRTRL